MKTSELDYELPEDRIAQRPPEKRDGGRMLRVEADSFYDEEVANFPDLIPDDSVLVLNNTRVRLARLQVHKSSGAKVELLFLRRLSGAGTLSGGMSELWEALGKSNRPLRVGERLVGESITFLVEGKEEMGILRLQVDSAYPLESYLDEHGHVALPPYVRRDDDVADKERYQTVFAEHLGSSAAPTASLHLSEAGLARIRERNIPIIPVTLHVGLGTFRPVSAENLSEHAMHAEEIEVSEDSATQLEQARKDGRRVVAIGTTVVRTLESAQRGGRVEPCRRSTQLLITPGYQFQVVDSLLTNFHAPRSTLIALVAAFATMPIIKKAYQHAIDNRYRMLSYGDATWFPHRID